MSPSSRRDGAWSATRGSVLAEDLLRATVEALATQQRADDGPAFYRGEFDMTLRCPEPRLDYNFLSGYTLLHLAVTSALLREALPRDTRRSIERILHIARELPGRYQSPRGTNNWYHGKLSGDHVPHEFAWPGGAILSIRDDLDDTAISALLCCLVPGCTSCVPYRAEVFSAHIVTVPAHLRPSSRRRLEASGVDRGVYMTWVLDHGDAAGGDAAGGPRRVCIPLDNTVEMVTVANVHAAVHNLSTDPPDPEAHRASATFVNRLLRHAVERLRCGDAGAMEAAARYYPRVPFAPIGFLLRDHVLSGGTLLDEHSLRAIGEAVCSIDCRLATHPEPLAAPLHWLVAAGWCLQLGVVDRHSLPVEPSRVLRDLACGHFDPSRGWDDFVFFKDAHVGHYSGRSYANAVAIEALALAIAHGVA